MRRIITAFHLFTTRFNPRTPCGVRLIRPSLFRHLNFVSIHALLAECDRQFNIIFYKLQEFQSTHSLRSATIPLLGAFRLSRVSIHALLAECDMASKITSTLVSVSIHALLAECDSVAAARRFSYRGFNPRTPCGVRQSTTRISWASSSGFNPRTPCGVRQVVRAPGSRVRPVSIHALLAECDRLSDVTQMLDKWFQSTHSLRSATIFGHSDFIYLDVSIHALLAECDCIKSIILTEPA